MFAQTLEPPAILLPLWDVVDDTVITTNGCYSRGLELIGLDSEHLSSDVLMEAQSHLYDGAKKELPDDAFLQLSLLSHRDYSDLWERFDSVPMPDDPLLRHQRERREAFLQSTRPKRFSIYAFIGSSDGFTVREFKNLSLKEHERRMQKTRDLQRQLISLTQRIKVPTRPLRELDLVRLFYAGTNPGSPMPAARHPDPRTRANTLPMLSMVSLRQQLCSMSVTWDDDYVRIGDSYFRVLSLCGLPDATNFTLMESFLQLRNDFRLSMMLSIPKQGAAQQLVKLNRRLAYSNANKNQNVPDADRVGVLQEATALSERITASNEKLVKAGLQLVISGASIEELDRQTHDVCDHLKKYEMTFAAETGRHDREYFKTLPGMGVGTWDRWHLMPSNNAMDLAPVFGACTGDRRPVFVTHTSRGELFSYDPMEPKRQNWNAAIFGDSGTGKSVLMNMLITTAQLSNVMTKGRLIVVDYAGAKKSSYLMIKDLFGGKFVPLLADSNSIALNPFPARHQAMSRDGQMVGPILDFLMVFTDLLLTNTGQDKDTQLFRGILQNGIQRMYRSLQNPAQAPTFGLLLKTLRADSRTRDVDHTRFAMLLRLLEMFLSGPHAALFNRQSTFDPAADDFLIFDLFGIEDYPENIQQALSFLVCSYVRRLAFNPKEDHRPKYINLDELPRLLRRPEMKPEVKSLFSTARKHKTSVWAVTQRYGEFRECSVADDIITNSTTHILLKNRAAQVRNQIIHDLDLNEREQHLFEKLNSRKGEYSEALLRTTNFDEQIGKERDVSAKIRIRLSPFDYQLATSDPSDRAVQKEWQDANPGMPLVEILDQLGDAREAQRIRARVAGGWTA